MVGGSRHSIGLGAVGGMIGVMIWCEQYAAVMDVSQSVLLVAASLHSV